MSRPLVSIMIPTYGQDSLVSRAVKSALAQTYVPLEVVVGDDASPDATRTMIEQFRDDRLRYHRNPRNLGRLGNYRHLLYHVARGDWAVNLDGDDCFTDPDFLSSAMQAAEEAGPDAVMVVGRVATIVDGHRMAAPLRAAGVMEGRHYVLRAADVAYHPMHLGCLYKRDLALTLDFYRSNAISSDWESIYRLACHGKVILLDREVGEWHVSHVSASEAISAQETLANLRIWQGIEDELVRTGTAPHIARGAMRAARMQVALGEAVRLARRGRSAEAMRVVRELPDASFSERARLAVHPRLWAHVLFGALRFSLRARTGR